MEQRTLLRFRKRAILIHWLHAVSFAVMLVTGALMFFNLASFSGGHQIRIIHQVAAVFFVAVPVACSVFDPKGTASFLREAFHWDRDGRAWLTASLRFYFGRQVQMPPQGYINGDQRLWQLVVIVTGPVLAVSGTLMWFFRLKMSVAAYQWILLTHGTAFVVVSVMFLVHFYLSTLHPGFGESLASMLDGKVSPSYAQDHYRKWYDEKTGSK